MAVKDDVYRPDDLCLRAHLTIEGPRADRHETTWEEAAGIAWVASREKAERVKVLLGVWPHEVKKAWRVTSCTHEETTTETGRKVNRASFELVPDPRLDYLVGRPDPWPQRNPVAIRRLDTLPGGELLVEDEKPDHGVAQVGAFSLIVGADGRAEVHGPAGATVAVTLHGK